MRVSRPPSARAARLLGQACLCAFLLAGTSGAAAAQQQQGARPGNDQAQRPPPPPPDWDRPLQSIGSIHADSNKDFVPDLVGAEVLVAGRVSAGTGLIRADIGEVYIQDGTGGLRLMMPLDAEPVLSGDSVLVHGRVSFRYGMMEIVEPSVQTIRVPSREVSVIELPNLPQPLGGAGPDMESHEGEMVAVRGRVVQVDSVASGHLFVILAGTSLIQVFAYSLRTEPLVFEVKVGDYLWVRGVAIQQDPQPPYNGSYVIFPLAPSDVRLAGVRPEIIRNTALAVGGLFLIALLWATILRQQVRRRTRALMLSEARYSHLFDAAADPVFVLDLGRGGAITEANRAAQRAFGIDADGLSADGRQANLRDLVVDEEEAAEHLREADQKERALGVFDLLQADGTVVPYEISSRKMIIRDEASLVAIARNVEQRRTYETGLLHAMNSAEEARAAAEDARRAAEEAARLKSTILANMSHEIRTPLTAILGFSDILREEVSSDLYEYADAIQTGGKRLLATLNDLFDLSRLDADNTTFEATPVDVLTVLRATMEGVSKEAQAKNLGLRLQASVASLPVVHSVDALQRVADAVIGNAVKFTDAGDVQVQLHVAEHYFAIRVRDTGVGIDAGFLPEIFEPFKQESDGHSRSFEGTGLGLSIAQRLVSRMGGEIRVWSQKGEGSLFEIALPRTEPGAQPIPVDAPSDHAQGDGAHHMAAVASSPQPIAADAPLVEAP